MEEAVEVGVVEVAEVVEEGEEEPRNHNNPSQ